MRSIGAYVPDKVLTNNDLEQMVDTTDEWIIKRTGIRERHIASEEQACSDLGYQAASVALKRSGLTPDQIDMVVVATISPDYFCMPSTACVLADKLDIRNVPAFDLSAACSGFIYALATAKAFIESGMAKNILIVGSEALSRIVDYTERTTCVLFGDGAGAAVISATDNPNEAILDVHISADGEYQDFLITPGGGSRHPCSTEVLENRLNYIKMRGNETFKVAVKTLTNDVRHILEANNIPQSAIDHFIPHQANHRIIKAVGDALGLEERQIVLTVEKYGNTSAASIPMAINDIYESGRLKKGDLMLLDAFGGGLTWGSALLHFGGN
ncbi:MAG: ketoacyl-ACP synthase III [Campylobacterales bacterium]